MPSWKTCLRVGVSAFLLFLCIRYWDVAVGLLLLAVRAATPIIAGCAIAFILNIPLRFFERHFFPNSQKPYIKSVRRGVCLLLAFVCVGVILTLLAMLVIPELVDCVELLVARVPDTLEDITDAIAGSTIVTPELAQWLDGLNWQELIEKVGGVVLNGFGSVANVAAGVITSVISVTFDALMALIFAVYVLAGKEQLGRQMKTLGRRYLKKSWREKISHVLAVVEDCFRDYIVGKGADAVILGVLCSLGMLIFRFPKGQFLVYRTPSELSTPASAGSFNHYFLPRRGPSPDIPRHEPSRWAWSATVRMGVGVSGQSATSAS